MAGLGKDAISEIGGKAAVATAAGGRGVPMLALKLLSL